MGTLRLGSSVVVPSVTVNGGSVQPVIDPLSITPTTSQQTITAPSGVDGYSPITVDAVDNTIDSNITANNIKSGVTILGVTGNVVELNGETKTIIPQTYGQTIYPTNPKNGITEITVNPVTSSIDANITAGNIKKDVQILGVTGTYEGSGGGNTDILKSVIAEGKTELSGTPTPSNPVDIMCNNGVLKLSPNLFNADSSNITLGYWINNNTGEEVSNASNFMTNAYIPVKPNTSYVAYGRRKTDNILSKWNRIAWYDSNKTYLSTSPYTSDTIGVDTSPSNAAYARFSSNPTANTVTQDIVDSFNWTFREGTQEYTQFIPYNSITVEGTPEETITDFDGNKAVIEDLLSINSNYTDTQNVVDGKVVSKTRILILNGTENWSSYNQYNLSTFTCSDFDKDGLPSSTKFNVLCNYYQSTTNGVLPEDGQIMFETSSGGLSTAIIKIHNDSFTDPTDFKAWLAQKYNDGNPVIIVAPRNNYGSVTYLVSPQVLVHTPISTTGYLDNLVVNTTVYDSPVHYVEKRMVKINNVNTLTNASPSSTSVPTAPINLKDVQKIDEYVFEDAHWKNSLILPRVAFINSEDLISISGEKACYRAFALSNVIKTGLNYLQAITGNYACQMAFYNCTSLIDIGLDRLITIGNSNSTGSCVSMFYGNTSLEKADFKMLSSVGGNLACQYMFQSCTKLKEIIYQSYINNSSTSSNIFSNMLSGVTGCTVHFPIASSNMSNWSDVIAGFGGTNTTVLFDIVRTCTVGGNNYVRSPLDSIGDVIAFKLNQSPNTIGYSNGEPHIGEYLYSDQECTVILGQITTVS